MQSCAERFSREPLKPVATIGKLLLLAYYIVYTYKRNTQTYSARVRRAYCTRLADVRYIICHFLANHLHVVYAVLIILYIRPRNHCSLCGDGCVYRLYRKGSNFKNLFILIIVIAGILHRVVYELSLDNRGILVYII